MIVTDSQYSAIPKPISDGLGHWFNEATQSWYNDDGTPYQEKQPYFNSALGAWDDQLGHYSYDEGATWGGVQSNAFEAYQPEYLGDSPNTGVYQQDGNTWENGNWWNANDEVWSDQLGGWFAPEKLKQAWQDILQHDASQFPNEGTPSMVPGALPKLSLGEWQSYVDDPMDRPAPNNPRAAFVDYDLANDYEPHPWGFNTKAAPSSGLPWDATFSGEQQGSGFWGGVGGAIKANPVTQIVGGYAKGINELADELTGSTYQERLNSNVSGNQFADLVTGGRANLDELPYGLDYVTDTALAPATIITAGMGPSVPLLGSAFGGGFGKQLAGETAIGALGLAGAELGASEQAESIPFFGDQPAWLRGLEAGAVGGLGGFAGAKALKGLGPEDFAPSGPVKSIYDESGPFPKLGTEAQYPRGVEVPQGPAFPQLRGAADDTSLNPIRQKIRDAVEAEYKWRMSGEAEVIKTGKRAEQAAGIDAAQVGATSGETIANIRSGARVGSFFDSTGGMRLSDNDFNAALADVMQNTRSFNKITTVEALDKLQNGVHLQPGEVKALGDYYGAEFAAKVRVINETRPQTVAELTPEDIAQINRRAEVDGKRIATLEVQAKAQHRLADDLVERGRMDPTNPRLKKAYEDARARAIAKENEADRLLADRAERATSGLPERTAAQIAKGEERFPTVKQAEAADRKALRAENKVRMNTDEQIVTKAKDVIAKLDVSDDLKSNLIDTIELGLRKQRVILDGMGEEGPNVLRKLYAYATGEVTDSYTSKLLTQRAFVENALQSQGMTRETAKKVAKLLQDAELRGRFGDNIPEYVLKSLDEAKFDFAEGGAIKGLADISQELKNTQFGIGDLAVFGQQGAKLAATNAPQFVAGLVNRVLNIAHLGADTGLDGMAKSTVYQLDGLAKKSVAITDLTNDRTIISRLGKPGKILDAKAVVPATRWLTDLQFDTILGKLREITYEGNLVLAKVVGEDITDPKVRLRAAEWANAASGAGKLAQRSERANLEKAFLLSAPMRRAQAQQAGQVLRFLNSKQDAVYALATISSMAGSLAIAKAINDRYGLTDFVWDPSKPGFGEITLPGGTVINPFSQEQVVKAFARSIRVIAEGDLTKEDALKIAEEWGKLGVSSASPGLRPFLAAVGVGYDPGKGYAWGDLGKGKGFGQRALDAAPVPPIVQSTIREGFDIVRTPLEAIGVNSYPESQFDALDRKVASDPEFGGKSYRDLTDPLLKAKAQEKYGKLDPFGPEGEEAAKTLASLTAFQDQDDTKLRFGEITPEQWRRWYTDRKNELFIRNDQTYAKLDLKSKDPILAPYYEAIEQSKAQNGGRVDWDAVDRYRATLDGPTNEYISTRTGLLKIDTSQTKAFEQIYDSIQKSGYFERSDENWREVADILGIEGFDSYTDYREDQLTSLLDAMGKTRQDVGAVAEAEKFLDKQEPAKGMTQFRKAWIEQWVLENPQEAYHAWKFGYYTPTDAIKKYLAAEFE